MESFEHLLPGNVLILGEKNKELELDSKVRKNLQNGDVFYNKSNNAVISNIVVTPSVDLYLVDLSSHSFASKVVLFKGENTVFNETLVRKYLVDTLDYKKNEKNIYITEYTRDKIKILYLYNNYTKYIQHTKKNIATYCNNRKYEFVYKYNKDFDKIRPKFDVIRKEISTCDTMLILYNYSFIADHSKSIDTFLTFNMGYTDKDEQVMLIDNIYGEWFSNFIIFNKINTLDILDELLLFFSKEKVSEIQISQYFKSHKNIKHNQFVPIFHNNTKSGYIGSFNGEISKFELERNLPFYINLYKTKSSGTLYNSIYLKEYSYKISDDPDINRMKFSFRGRLEISKTNHKYKELDSHIYEIVIDKDTFIITFDDDFESFRGVQIGVDKPKKIEGILIII